MHGPGKHTGVNSRLLAGRLLGGRYRIEKPLGQGAMAEVLAAFDERLERPVAVKLLRPELSVRPDMRARFEQEARAAARLSHPNVVGVFDTGEDGGAAYLVMERLPGRTLADRIAAGPIPVEQVVQIGTDVLAALAEAHRCELVHRDVKPGNILLTEEGRAKVADFGIAKTVAERPGASPGVTDLTEVGMVIGTPAYLAPERLAGRPASIGSDLYAVGVVLFEALTGHKPVPGEGATAQIPPALAAVLDRAMAAAPEERYPTAAAMAADLLAAGRAGPVERSSTPTVVLGDTTVPLASRAGRAPAAPRALRRRPIVALGALAGALVLALVLALAAGNGGSHQASSTRADPQATQLERAAAQIAADRTPGASELAQALRGTAVTPAGPRRATAAQGALDLAQGLLARGSVTPAEYATAAAALEQTGAVAPTTTTTTTTTTAPAPPPTPAPPAPHGPGKPGHGHGDG